VEHRKNAWRFAAFLHKFFFINYQGECNMELDKSNARLLIGIGVALVVFVLCLAVACLFVYFFLYPAYFARSTPESQDALLTQGAQTVVAQLTQTAAAIQATSTGLPPSATQLSTLPPSATPQPTATFIFVPPTSTPIPPTSTPVPIPCNWAKFVGDVTVKDGTEFPPNAEFVKTWEIKNIGSCSWKSDTLLVFAGGEQMDGAKASQIGETVDPGETTDVSVALVAPEDPGRYRGFWKLSTASGDTFGIGSNADDPFWVDIRVIESGKYTYDFTSNYCSAKWRSEAGQLPCPGEKGDGDGFVILVNKPVIESDRQENESGLWTQPEEADDGYIAGEYPEIEIKTGYRFQSVIACLDGATNCDVVFQLNYRIGDGSVQTLWQGQEEYDGEFTKLDIDLNPLAGQKVKFVLTVLANGSPDDDEAFWLQPRIVDVD
jgi:hypothetical protein